MTSRGAAFCSSASLSSLARPGAAVSAAGERPKSSSSTHGTPNSGMGMLGPNSNSSPWSSSPP
eukprot:CAMPEP_0181271658 /NCGR_PEP_ID=MMETSP1097-20121128/7527_1 /TAXON_ID=35684 /ORGANISM="Pseudopedinella elastica, Strain CCMP716" /LENGTH=62 /DNA_ID=CAMNT_0023372119 /DNA_START=116 /DNA_END=300 /DNA_ORIENTATION=-